MYDGPFTLSYTDFSNYLTCPYRFYLHSSLKARKIYPRAIDSRRFLNGWVAHKCLELWNTYGHWQLGWMQTAVVELQGYERNQPKIVPVGIDADRANLVPVVIQAYLDTNDVIFKGEDGPVAVAERMQSGLASMEFWALSLEFNKREIVSEYRFKELIPGLNITIKGSIDLFDKSLFDLYDMKFSSNGYTDWRQLLWYDWVISYLTGRKVNAVHTFNPLQSQPISSRNYVKEDLTAFTDEVADVVCKIRRREFPITCDLSNCFNCIVSRECSKKVLG
jgi:hypothetical protein